MTKKEKKALHTFQMGELGAVVMYKRLAELVKDEAMKSELLHAAADEGKHAGILKTLSGETMKPKNILKNPVVLGYRFLGRKAIFKILSKSERFAAKLYKKYFDVFPEVISIAEDELRHGETMARLAKVKLSKKKKQK